MTLPQAQAIDRSPPCAPRARPPSLAERAARAFPKHAFLPGYALFAGGHVAIGASTSGGVDAIVRSSRPRPVRVRVADGGVAIGCACTPTSLEGDGVGCKHAWAVLLEIDRLALLEPLRASASPLRVTRLDVVADGAPAPEPSAEPRRKAKPAKAGPAIAPAKAPKPERSASPPPAKAPPAKAAGKPPAKAPAKTLPPTKRSRRR